MTEAPGRAQVSIISRSLNYIRVEPGFSMKTSHLAINALSLWFIFQVLYFAVFVIPDVPDFQMHYFISKIYYENPFHFPFQDKLEYYSRIGHTPASPYLYHLLMGWLMHSNFLDLHPLLFAGLLNFFLALITLFFAVAFVKEISEDIFVQLCSLAILTNTLMFSFLYSGINHDNLTNLCALASFYYFARYLKRGSRQELIALALFCSIGALTKITFLPLILFFLFFLLINIGKILTHSENFFVKWTPREITLLGLCLVFLTLNLRHYFGNIYNYGEVLPGETEVRGEENARDPATERNRALIATATEREKDSWPIFVAKWLQSSVKGMIEIASHEQLTHSRLTLRIATLFFFLAFLVLAFRFREWSHNKIDFYILLICISYAILVCFANYSFYSKTHKFGVGLQGRYLFPVYFPFVVLLVKYNLWELQSRTKLVTCILCSFFFFNLGIIYFFFNAGSSWYKTPW